MPGETHLHPEGPCSWLMALGGAKTPKLLSTSLPLSLSLSVSVFLLPPPPWPGTGRAKAQKKDTDLGFHGSVFGAPKEEGLTLGLD